MEVVAQIGETGVDARSEKNVSVDGALLVVDPVGCVIKVDQDLLQSLDRRVYIVYLNYTSDSSVCADGRSGEPMACHNCCTPPAGAGRVGSRTDPRTVN
mgnify:CR=1 FL=1